MADAKQRRFDAVCVWKLDRFGRSLRHLVNALADLESLGVSFITLKDNLDLATPSGRLMFQTIGAMAESARSLIQESDKPGLRNARAKGEPHGKNTEQKLKYYRQAPEPESAASGFKADSASRRTSSYFSPR